MQKSGKTLGSLSPLLRFPSFFWGAAGPCSRGRSRDPAFVLGDPAGVRLFRANQFSQRYTPACRKFAAGGHRSRSSFSVSADFSPPDSVSSSQWSSDLCLVPWPCKSHRGLGLGSIVPRDSLSGAGKWGLPVIQRSPSSGSIAVPHPLVEETTFEIPICL